MDSGGVGSHTIPPMRETLGWSLGRSPSSAIFFSPGLTLAATSPLVVFTLQSRLPAQYC